MALIEFANRIARAKPDMSPIEFGPWAGSMRSVSAEQVPRNYLADGRDFLYMPRTGTWRRRLGQTQKFDTFGAAVGMLPAQWSDAAPPNNAKCRQLSEFDSPVNTDLIPSVCALITKETMASSSVLDDGRFSNFWWRDQVDSANRTIGSEYSTATYPVPGTVQPYKIIPLWYDSGDGGLTRGVSEFARRFFVSGSRRFQKVGSWMYHPSYHGTPSRWNMGVAGTASETLDTSPGEYANGYGVVDGIGGDNGSLALRTDDGTTSYVQGPVFSGGGIVGEEVTLDLPTNPASFSGWKLGFVARRNGTGNLCDDDWTVYVNRAYAANVYSVGTVAFQSTPFTSGGTWLKARVTASYAAYEYDIDAADAQELAAATRVSVLMRSNAISGGGSGDAVIEVTQIYITVPASTGSGAAGSDRLIPSGPWPPTHSGIITAGSQTANATTYVIPDADSSDGTWTASTGTPTVLFNAIDDITDSDYILSTASGVCKIRLSDIGFVPTSDATIVLRWNAVTGSGIGTTALFMELIEGASTVIASSVSTPLGTTQRQYELTLTPAQITSVTDWTNLFVQFTSTITGGVEVRVHWWRLEHSVGVGTLGGWKGLDQFYYAVAYRFEDDSIWMPCPSRGPNDLVTAGFDLFTVSSANPSAIFMKLTWSNLPVPPAGVKRLVLLRTNKIDSTVQSTLALNSFSLKIVDEVDAGITTYDDFKADDLSLVPDPDGLFVRYDHIMPPAARYLFAGAQRVCHAYGKVNPAAITIAPVGQAVDYDLNVADTSTTAYTSADAMYVRLSLDSSAVLTLTLNKSDGTTLNAQTIACAGLSLQELVDTINASTCTLLATTNPAGQWRAQLCPGVNPEADATTALLPHIRAIASCVVSGQTITKSAGGLSKVAVGALISGTGVTTGAYVSVITSDTSLTFVGTITPATVNLSFYFELGDTPTAATANAGYQRVIANSLPGFLYFNNTYLAQFTVDKQATWMTVASPASVRSAPNCFRGEQRQVSNTFRPPEDAGIAMGGFAVAGSEGYGAGFVILYARMSAAIKNTRDTGTGIDSDYQLNIINPTRGCCAWNSVTPGPRMGFFFSPIGFVAIDLEREVEISKDIYEHPDSDAATGIGDFSYEAPLCVAATAQDNDGAYLAAKVLRGILWVTYRVSADTHPSRMLAFDMSSNDRSAGLETVIRDSPIFHPETQEIVVPAGGPWGWSLPLVRSMTALGEGRRSDGAHLYGWNEQNAGSTGDGRIDEFETSQTDNGSAIASATANLPYIQRGDGKLVVYEALCFHSSPASSTGSLDYWRGFSAVTATQSLTLTTSANVTSRDRKILKLSSQPVTEAFHFRFLQTAGTARELKRLLVKVAGTIDYRPAA